MTLLSWRKRMWKVLYEIATLVAGECHSTAYRSRELSSSEVDKKTERRKDDDDDLPHPLGKHQRVKDDGEMLHTIFSPSATVVIHWLVLFPWM
ncbi:hypothetical protein KQX54_004954 [Cotesia glomerata]|uniref:Uncharacterized protein n=1 Tax=Cotesia glomerata TaxID=32391 RepID=A0AAV7J286_COTGL|nr:hypothetical protein KQX54_004954 [Cotesia glomerata]